MPLSGTNVPIPAQIGPFHFFGPNILKEADINVFFKVLAKFGDYKHNKDIKKIRVKMIKVKVKFLWKLLMFLFIETFPYVCGSGLGVIIF